MPAVNRSPYIFDSKAAGSNLLAYGTSGTGPDLPVAVATELALDVTVQAFVGGTAPTVTVSVQRKGADGVYYTIYAGTALSAAGVQSISLGAGLGSGASANVSFGSVLRVVFTPGGTVSPTAVTGSFSLIGK